MGWIHPAQDMAQWQSIVNTVMNHGILLEVRNFLSSGAITVISGAGWLVG